jgi:hypothetical protein
MTRGGAIQRPGATSAMALRPAAMFRQNTVVFAAPGKTPPTATTAMFSGAFISRYQGSEPTQKAIEKVFTIRRGEEKVRMGETV